MSTQNIAAGMTRNLTGRGAEADRQREEDCRLRKQREQSEWREREERKAQEAEVNQLKADYASLKREEVELERAVNSVTRRTDYRLHFRRSGELNALREILNLGSAKRVMLRF